MTFWAHFSKVVFRKRSVKMIDDSEKRKRQLAFELQSLRVFEKHTKRGTRWVVTTVVTILA